MGRGFMTNPIVQVIVHHSGAHGIHHSEYSKDFSAGAGFCPSSASHNVPQKVIRFSAFVELTEYLIDLVNMIHLL